MCLALLFMSGLQIFNAHPALYWGDISTFDNPLAAIGDFSGLGDHPVLPGSGGRTALALLLCLAAGHQRRDLLLASILSRHISRDLIPTRAELGRIGHSIAEHIRLALSEGRGGASAIMSSSNSPISS